MEAVRFHILRRLGRFLDFFLQRFRPHRARIVRRNHSDRVVEVKGLVVREVPLFDEFVQLHRTEYNRDAATVMLDSQDFAGATIGGEEYPSNLNVIDLRCVRVESPGHAVRREGLDCLVAVLHQDDVVLVSNARSSLRSNSETNLALRKVAELDGMAHLDWGVTQQEACPERGRWGRSGVRGEGFLRGLAARAIEDHHEHEQNQTFRELRMPWTWHFLSELLRWTNDFAHTRFSACLTGRLQFPWPAA